MHRRVGYLYIRNYVAKDVQIKYKKIITYAYIAYRETRHYSLLIFCLCCLLSLSLSLSLS